MVELENEKSRVAPGLLEMDEEEGRRSPGVPIEAAGRSGGGGATRERGRRSQGRVRWEQK